MRIFRGRSFTNSEIVLDGRGYDNCCFRGCILIYRGGSVQMTNNSFDGCAWRLECAAERAMLFLAALYQGTESAHSETFRPMRRTAMVIFHRIIQDAHDYKCFDHNEDYVVAKIYFTLEIDGQTYEESVEVRQPYGTDYESLPFEGKPPVGPYRGSWNHVAFLSLTEKYYRGLVGRLGTAIAIGSASRDIRMRNNEIVQEAVGYFEIPA
jgi:hypothetical protein